MDSENVPVFLQLELQFQTFHLHLALFFVFENALIGFPVLWRCLGPHTGTIRSWFMNTQRRKIAEDISVCAAADGVRQPPSAPRAARHTHLPRGVVRPMPLYMLTERTCRSSNSELLRHAVHGSARHRQCHVMRYNSPISVFASIVHLDTPHDGESHWCPYPTTAGWYGRLPLPDNSTRS